MATAVVGVVAGLMVGADLMVVAGPVVVVVAGCRARRTAPALGLIGVAGAGIQTIGLGEAFVHVMASVLGIGTLPLGLLGAALSLLRFLLGLEADALRIQGRLLSVEVLLADGVLLLFRGGAQLLRAASVLRALLGLLAAGAAHREHDDEGEEQHDNDEDDRDD